MKPTLSLVAAPGDRLHWQIGDRLWVTLFEEASPVSQPYRVTYVDPQRVSLEAIPAETPPAPMLHDPGFICPECGPHVKADEDGCCAGCGNECNGTHLVDLSRREQERQMALETRANSICVHIDRDSLVETEVVRRRQRDGSSLWRVKRLSSVLMRDGTWEPEPQPSSRDDEWIARASWPSAAEAEAAFRRHSRAPHQEKV